MLAARDAAARGLLLTKRHGHQQHQNRPPLLATGSSPRIAAPAPVRARADDYSYSCDDGALTSGRDGGASASSSSSGGGNTGGARRSRRPLARAPSAAATAFAAPAVGAPPPLAPAAPPPPPLPERAAALADRLAALPDARARLAFLLKAARDADEAAADTSAAAAALRSRPEARVIGCTTATFCAARLAADGRTVEFDVDSDSQLSKGLGAVLCDAMRGLSADAAASFDASGFLRRARLAAVDASAVAGGAASGASAATSEAGAYTRDRADGAANLAAAMRRRAAALSPRGAALRDVFPSLIVTADTLTPRGAFAEAQARYLRPEPEGVRRLGQALRDASVGVVAHFYMDPEVQGALMSVAAPGSDGSAPLWPHVHISDSLVMADAAVRMAREGGCKAIAVLGVDFMSENVRAILDEAGFQHVDVYRLSSESIGCSLAEAAEGPGYDSFLRAAAEQAEQEGGSPALHVVYINTSLRTKARAHALVPTITCTSSNVVQTVLQAFAQCPDARVHYGPDTYMGRNLTALFSALAKGEEAGVTDDDVRALHPSHTVETVRKLLPRLHHYEEGSCVVHHIFGGEVAEAVRLGYSGDAFLTAHFEVPGEMFALAMEARARGAGVVGSTSNILDFIADKVGGALREATAGGEGGGGGGNGSGSGGNGGSSNSGTKQRVRFVLGTEAGMITSIVRRVQAMLRDAPATARDAVEVEIIFPVATGDAITTEATAGGGAGGAGGSSSSALPEGLAVVPGPAGGEGCSLEGGCAACPYMRMNTLDALMRVARMAGASASGDAAAKAMLLPYRPAAYEEQMALPEGAGPEGVSAGTPMSVARAGCVPILHMRGYGRLKRLPDALVDDMRGRFGGGGRRR
jgi:quinolinate synthase